MNKNATIHDSLINGAIGNVGNVTNEVFYLERLKGNNMLVAKNVQASRIPNTEKVILKDWITKKNQELDKRLEHAKNHPRKTP